jgi:transposase-like protein
VDRETTEVSARAGAVMIEDLDRHAPDPEVSMRAKRRRFTAEYKLRIVRAADAARDPGEIGTLLRREGLYSSHLASWRKQYRDGARRGLAAKKRGPPRERASAEALRVQQLERELARMKQRLDVAETIIAFQKKASEILGIDLERPPSDERKS